MAQRAISLYGRGNCNFHIMLPTVPMNDNEILFTEQTECAAMKDAALSYVAEAFAEARLDGLDGDFVAQAALCAAFNELVETYGEDATAEYAAGLADRIKAGEFSLTPKH